jgi:hypothetical protein
MLGIVWTIVYASRGVSRAILNPCWATRGSPSLCFCSAFLLGSVIANFQPGSSSIRNAWHGVDGCAIGTTRSSRATQGTAQRSDAFSGKWDVAGTNLARITGKAVSCMLRRQSGGQTRRACGLNQHNPSSAGSSAARWWTFVDRRKFNPLRGANWKRRFPKRTRRWQRNTPSSEANHCIVSAWLQCPAA